MFKVPERYRVTEHAISRLATTAEYGNNGAFVVPLPSRLVAWCIASDGEGWEHVSVLIKKATNMAQIDRCPTWAEMCAIKELFWDDPDDCVVQFHPAAKHYVNNHRHCLHLWRPTEDSIPVPSPWLVGIPKGAACR